MWLRIYFILIQRRTFHGLVGKYFHNLINISAYSNHGILSSVNNNFTDDIVGYKDNFSFNSNFCIFVRYPRWYSNVETKWFYGPFLRAQNPMKSKNFGLFKTASIFNVKVQIYFGFQNIEFHRNPKSRLSNYQSRNIKSQEQFLISIYYSTLSQGRWQLF